MAKRIVFTGGGTVGHVTLNLILMPQFLADGWELHYIGDGKGVEYQQVKESGLPVTFHTIATGKLRRYFSWQNLLDVFKVGLGILQSLVILSRLRPQALFSKGGFVSVPPVIAAKASGVPVFIHESDLSMGLANKIASRFATRVYTTFEPESKDSKFKHLGAVTKVGQELILTEDNQAILSEVEATFDSHLPTLLFIGGSGGAKVFNDFISQTPDLLQVFNVINLTGDISLDSLSERLYRLPYATDLYQPLMDLADVVVTRGGSNTLFELLAMQKLHLIIPLGKDASRGDQLENAAYFVKQGYARQISEKELDLTTLQSEVELLLADKASYQAQMASSKELTSPVAFYQQLLKDMG